MALFEEGGHCTVGYYAGHDNIRDLQTCLDQCLAEDECQYVAFYDQESCSRYGNGSCEFKTNKYATSNLYTTYLKVQKGMNSLFLITNLQFCRFTS